MFLDRFTKLSEERGLSISRAASEIGLSNSTTTKWARGAIPSSKTLQKIAAYFNVSVAYLIGEEETEKAPSLSEERLLDEYEKEFLELSRELPPEMKKSLLNLVRMYVQDKEGK